MELTRKLRSVGNSKGVIIPSQLIEKYGLSVEVTMKETADGILITASKPSFDSVWNNIRDNKVKLYNKMEQQAKTNEAQNYYKNPENTPFIDIDNEII